MAIKRNDFTKIFGGIGRRKSIKNQIKKKTVARSKMQKIRRAHQGWRNKIFGSLQALKIRLQYGRRKPIPQFRR
jgi:hypothetical protein